jgi:pyruvate kinase
MARTKIVCTIGPSCESREIMRALIRAGMSVARLNFSHGSPENHRTLYQRLRQVADEEKVPLCIMQDLSGPKIRIGTFKEGSVYLHPGERFVLTEEKVDGDKEQVHVPLPHLTELVQPGCRVLLSDGLIELTVKQVQPSRVITEVIVGGTLSDRKGIFFPGQNLAISPLTEKDLSDLETGLELGVDYIALSFVRNHQDVDELKERIEKKKGTAKVVAKLERPEAIEDLDNILEAADAVMIARGDLGIEMEPEQVPLVQKRVIREAQRRDVFAIVATQMLESMIRYPRPTRAEASDVANAVIDGTDAVMLSGETATGKYPVRTVQIMERIARLTEQEELDTMTRQGRESIHRNTFAGAVSWAAGGIADLIQAEAICAFTMSGGTAKLISKSRPAMPIIGLTPDERVASQLNLAWGVKPIVVSPVSSPDEMVQEVERVLREQSIAANGEGIVIVAGVPLNKTGITNLIKIHRVGESDPSDWLSSLPGQ